MMLKFRGYFFVKEKNCTFAPNFIRVKIVNTVIVLLLFLFQGGIIAQNPFELRQVQTGANASNDSTHTLKAEQVDPGNPFEIKHVPANYIIRDTLMIKKPVPITSKVVASQNFLFVTISILLLFLTILVVMNRGLLANLYRAIFSDSYLKMVYRFQNNSQTLSYGLFYLLFFLNAGLFLLLLLKHFKLSFFNSDILLFFACVGVMVLIYFVRHTVLKLIGLVFPVQKEVNYFNFTILAFNIFLGITLLPINGLISFSNEKISDFCLYAGVILIGLMYCVRQLRGMFLAANYLTYQKFHFFIYLCTVEIAPVLILARILYTTGVTL